MPRTHRLTSVLAGRGKAVAAAAAAAAVLAGGGAASAAALASAPSASAATHVANHHSAAIKAAAKTASAKSGAAKSAPALAAPAPAKSAPVLAAPANSAPTKSAPTKSAPAQHSAPAMAFAPATPAASAAPAPAPAKPAAPAAAQPGAVAKPAAPAPAAPAAAPAPAAPAAAPAPAPAPAQPFRVYDSVTPSAIPSGAAVATYADGGYAVNPAQVAGRNVTWIDTNGSDPRASALDVEPGDATPAMAANWTWHKLHNAANSIAIIYTMRSEWPAAQAAVATLPAPMQSHVRWWIADPTGVPHIVPGSSATQWYWGTNYDITRALPGSGL